MNHTTIPVTAQGEPIPMVKLGQGREPDHGNAEAAGFMGLLDSHNEALAKRLFYGDCNQGSEHERRHGEQMAQSTLETFAEKLRKAGYQEPVLPKTIMAEMLERRAAGLAEKAEAELPSVVSREGFRAGVLSAIAGGLIIAGVYLVWGIVAVCLFTAVCIGFVAGMLITQEWK